MFDGITNRLTRMQTAISRATLVPLLVKTGVAATFAGAMIVAWPAAIVFGQFVLPLLLFAIYPAFAPRGRGPTLAVLVVVGGWVAGTTWYDGRVEAWRVIAIGTFLYLGHTLAALAAVLPYDGVVNLDVVVRWLLRAGAAVLISAVLTVIALGLSDALAGSAFVLATVVGLAAATAATLLLARLLRRTGN
ncbi:hypothetical protein [Actinoplanes sp. NPDC089786]|uniref:hypothetical protein n=1 Tax=Actinoplanes sp. NPDC089786 TaxID=3155185 RepID=UPI0034166F96